MSPSVRSADSKRRAVPIGGYSGSATNAPRAFRAMAAKDRLSGSNTNCGASDATIGGGVVTSNRGFNARWAQHKGKRMEYSKTPPKKEGYYRLKNIVSGEKRVAELHGFDLWFLTDLKPGKPSSALVINGWEFGPEVLFDNTIADYKCSYGLHEQVACFSFGQFLAHEPEGSYEETARKAKDAAIAFIKVMSEQSL